MAAAAAIWVVVALYGFTVPCATSASSASGEYYTRVSPVTHGEPAPRVIRCARNCAQDGGCVAFSYDTQSQSCTLITNPALVAAASGVVYMRTSDTAAPSTSTAAVGPTPHWGGLGSYTCRSETKQIAYMGTMSTAEGGEACDTWSTTMIVQEGFMPDASFAEGNPTAAHNYCRTVGSHYGVPFCVSGGSQKFCNIPICP